MSILYPDQVLELIEKTDLSDEQKKLIIEMARQFQQRIDSQLNRPSFDESTFLKKIKELVSLCTPFTYEPTKDLPRDGEWRTTKNYFKHEKDKFFKVGLIRGRHIGTDQTYIQPILLQEFSQYDEYGCEKTVGEINLPVRKQNFEIEVGLTAISSPGVGLKNPILITAPRHSISSQNRWTALNTKRHIYQTLLRADSNRQTGRTLARVVEQKSELDGVVWFNLAEVERLIDLPSEKLSKKISSIWRDAVCEDAQTIVLLNWVLAHEERIYNALEEK
ncbi:hypothetical protein IT412_05880 [Candidatus Peregrinibacteria bacterium]|nr:hypothetical protein [Candidatus Peregrinibacteria bacterium]